MAIKQKEETKWSYGWIKYGAKEKDEKAKMKGS